MGIEKDITIEDIENRISEFSLFQDTRGAYECYKDISAMLGDVKENEIETGIYDCLIRLKFLALSFFDDWKEVEGLLRNHFEQIYRINYYDLWNNIKLKLLLVPEIDDRNKIKNQLINVILECDRIIVNRQKYAANAKLPVTVAEWLNNYRSEVGGGAVDSFAKTKYLTGSQYMKLLDKEDKNKIVILINFFEKLKTPSDTPQGFEEDVPMVIDGKKYIYKNGELEEIGPNIVNFIKSIVTDDGEAVVNKGKGIIGIPKTPEEKQIDRIKTEQRKYGEESIEHAALDEEVSLKQHVENLKIEAKKYKEGSLERMAMEEEINKLEE